MLQVETSLQQPTEVSRTLLYVRLSSGTIQVEREEEAYPLLSLVADCGGVLGLFIGFNFLMVWDGMINIVTRFPFKALIGK